MYDIGARNPFCCCFDRYLGLGDEQLGRKRPATRL